MPLIVITASKVQKEKTKTGLCGHAPGNHLDNIQFLVKYSIDSTSCNPAALMQGIENIAETENKLGSVRV
jgi:phosphoenolpyruvate synthase/pyruvate phosphate dikinase